MGTRPLWTLGPSREQPGPGPAPRSPRPRPGPRGVSPSDKEALWWESIANVNRKSSKPQTTRSEGTASAAPGPLHTGVPARLEARAAPRRAGRTCHPCPRVRSSGSHAGPQPPLPTGVLLFARISQNLDSHGRLQPESREGVEAGPGRAVRGTSYGKATASRGRRGHRHPRGALNM